MGSLFGKIFIAFWLTLILLGAAMYFGERGLGDRQLERSEHWLGAHAETATALLREGDNDALRRWLRGIRRDEGLPVLLLDGAGQPLFRQHLPPALHQRLPQLVPIEAGSQRLERGRYLVLAPLALEGNKLFLATLVDTGRLHTLSPTTRLILALLISALVSLGLAAMLSRPIRRLRHAAQTLADGDLNIRVGGRGGDEVAALGRDFDIMAERLREMLESQRRLLRDVSHELRSPLARLRIALELAERSAEPAKSLARVEKEADELELLLANLLSLSRLESGQSLLERRELSLGELLHAIISDADFEAQAHGRRVTLEMSQDFMVKGDPVLLRAAIENVVRNAVRYTAEDTTVEVSLAGSGGMLTLQVCDRGEGVPETALERMFEPFTRIGEARDRDSGGYGLGLAITGQVMAAHGGTVNAHNRTGGGLCVTLSLPTAEAD
ncbi:MAG: ATP-binding protein [Gammaproteobacteria bacterium]|nr:ATP-binding protein [Gammaproteobacteria bacterium]MCW8972010.1 ATP-binding protein [Gammaproteobacteria bacterium]MCW8991949.1 ATP-binding protein [Gammaproteobacteria bacterium]